MGYQDITLYKLKFEGREGLEVTAEGLSTGDLLKVTGLAEMMRAKSTAELSGADTKTALDGMIAILAAALVEWNVEDRNGQPVPATAEGITSLKIGLVMDIISAWVAAQADVDPTSPPASSDGATAAELEAEMPMTSPGS